MKNMRNSFQEQRYEIRFSGSGGQAWEKAFSSLENQGEFSGPERCHDPLCSQRDIMDQVMDVPKIRNQDQNGFVQWPLLDSKHLFNSGGVGSIHRQSVKTGCWKNHNPAAANDPCCLKDGVRAWPSGVYLTNLIFGIQLFWLFLPPLMPCRPYRIPNVCSNGNRKWPISESPESRHSLPRAYRWRRLPRGCQEASEPLTAGNQNPEDMRSQWEPR